MTTTQFVREAALKTGTVVTPTPWKEKDPGKKPRKGMDNQVRMGDFTGIVMTDPEMEDVPDTRCWLCGGATGGRGLPVKKAIKDTFTDRDKARWPASRSVCPGCVFCLSFMSLRNYSILATADELRHPGRAEIRDLLLEPPEPPFVLCIAVSGQRWLHFRAKMAYSRDGFPVQYEDTPVCVERSILREWLGVIGRLYAVFTKAEILTGQYGQNRIRQFGLAEFQGLEEQIAGHRGTRLFDLAVFVSQKQEAPAAAPEKEEKACKTSGIQNMSDAKNAEQQLSLFSEGIV